MAEGVGTAGLPVEDDRAAVDVGVDPHRGRLRDRVGLRLDRRRDGLGRAGHEDLVAALGVADAEDPVPDLLAARGMLVPGLRLAADLDRRDHLVVVTGRPAHRRVLRSDDLVVVGAVDAARGPVDEDGAFMLGEGQRHRGLGRFRLGLLGLGLLGLGLLRLRLLGLRASRPWASSGVSAGLSASSALTSSSLASSPSFGVVGRVAVLGLVAGRGSSPTCALSSPDSATVPARPLASCSSIFGPRSDPKLAPSARAHTSRAPPMAPGTDNARRGVTARTFPSSARCSVSSVAGVRSSITGTSSTGVGSCLGRRGIRRSPRVVVAVE